MNIKKVIKYYLNYVRYSLKCLISTNEKRIHSKRKEKGYRFLFEYFSGRIEKTENMIRDNHVDSRFPEKKDSSGKKHKKNAVFVYGYKPEVYSENYYYPPMGNIGDYIQSLAAMQFFDADKIEYVDRDNVFHYDSDEVNLIANGWHYFYEGNKIFSEKINPLFVSFHISNTESVSGETIDFLRKHQPIGCRDYATRDFLLSKNVDAYFSSCLTTTLDTYAVNDDERNEKVIFCDYDKSDVYIHEVIGNIVGDRLVENTEHLYEKNMSPDACFDEAKRLLDIYARASLVVTTRIHCALPCLALNTPVILCVPYYDIKRFKGLDQMLNMVGYNENQNLFAKISYDENGNVVNPENYKVYADQLKKACHAFVNDAA